jgi:hypothetical protein
VRCEGNAVRSANDWHVGVRSKEPNSRRSCANRIISDIFHRRYCTGTLMRLYPSSRAIDWSCHLQPPRYAKYAGGATRPEPDWAMTRRSSFRRFSRTLKRSIPMPISAPTFGNQITDRGEAEKCFHMTTGHVIVFRAGHPRNLGASAAPPDWAKTTRLMITGIERANA